MDREQTIVKLVEETKLTSKEAGELVDDLIALRVKEDIRTETEADLRKISGVLLLYDGVEEVN